MPEERFSFRWGVKWLDRGWLQVPSLFFDCYQRAGVTRMEFLFVLHLARYRFESSWGEARPSLSTIAGEMGCTVRTVQRLRRSLQGKGYLEVLQVPGFPSVYSFQGLAGAMVRLAGRGDSGVRGDMGVTPTPDKDVAGGVTLVSPEEEQQEQKDKQQRAAAALSPTAGGEEARKALLESGVSEEAAKRLLLKHGSSRILTVVARAKEHEGIRNVPGWIVQALDRDYFVGPAEEDQAGATASRRALAACAYRRNPQLGICPGESGEREAWTWCATCDRLLSGSGPVERGRG